MAIARGLEGVAVASTRLSHVDGERGELVIGGFAVEELAPRARFEEALFLLWHGRLPQADEHEVLRRELAAQRWLPAATLALLRAAAARPAGVMEALEMAVATLGLAGATDAVEGRDAGVVQAIRLVARFPTIVAGYWRLRQGLEPVPPSLRLGHAANYLYMLTGSEPSSEAARALEVYLNTVIDHGMNASTFTARVITSTGSDMVSALVGAVGALKGPLHGGAPGPALDMVFEIRGRAAESGRSMEEEAEAWGRDTIAAGGRIMGFGHRVYKVRDPRAEVLGAAAVRLFAGADDARLYDDARTVENAVLRVLHELKPGRRLETNVEFYTALLLHGVGLHSDLFTPTFAVARAGGWTAHVLEQAAENRLIRPSSEYLGPRGRRWPDGSPSAPRGYAGEEAGAAVS